VWHYVEYVDKDNPPLGKPEAGRYPVYCYQTGEIVEGPPAGRSAGYAMECVPAQNTPRWIKFYQEDNAFGLFLLGGIVWIVLGSLISRETRKREQWLLRTDPDRYWEEIEKKR